jgi:hypothetical protein
MQAMRYVLTNETPTVSPLRTVATSVPLNSLDRRASITLICEPWLSDDTVLRAYRRAQRMLFSGRNAHGSLRNFRVFRFVAEHSDAQGKHPPVRQLAAAWNLQYPAEAYSDFRQFWRDYRCARKVLIHPYYDQHISARFMNRHTKDNKPHRATK